MLSEAKHREKSRFGATPKPARGTRALPGSSILDLVELDRRFDVKSVNVTRF